ncbi:transposase [Candidatus Microthrix parvicella]|uniref:transposase n=1 Tax=Candidatus Neomicrothrix parvicella TaxID=41950 RepID=UPI00138B02CF
MSKKSGQLQTGPRSSLLGRTGWPSRCRRADAFASYTGSAPIEASSGERIVHRLSRGGDRQLNSALHLVAVTQVRMRNSAGRSYFDRKIAEGKTRNEAMRCFKRKLAGRLWRSNPAGPRSRRAVRDHPKRRSCRSHHRRRFAREVTRWIGADDCVPNQHPCCLDSHKFR